MLYSGALTKKPKPVAIKSRNHTRDNRFGESMLYQETTEKTQPNYPCKCTMVSF
jgi:hypothetical protein